jgi:hypothetical protein
MTFADTLPARQKTATAQDIQTLASSTQASTVQWHEAMTAWQNAVNAWDGMWQAFAMTHQDENASWAWGQLDTARQSRDECRNRHRELREFQAGQRGKPEWLTK